MGAPYSAVVGLPYVGTTHGGYVHRNATTGLQELKKSNLIATTDPTVGDDTDDGYAVGSQWINVSSGSVFTCTNAAAGAANWTLLGGGSGVGIPAGTGTEVQYRVNATTFGAVAGSAWNGTTLTLPQVVVGSANGIDIDPGSDADVDLLTVGVTGAPKLWWDQSEKEFVASKVFHATDFTTTINGITRVRGNVSLKAPLSNLQKGTSDTAVIVVFGDSWVAGRTWTDPLRKLLQQYFGDAGAGYCAADSYNNPPENITRGTTGTWTDASSTHSLSLGQTTSTDTATPATKTFTSMATTYVIHYLRQSGGGSFRYRIGAGSWTTVDTSHTESLYATVSVATGSFANHTLTIEVTVAGGSGVTLFGVDSQSSVSGVRLSTCAQNGKSAQNFAGINATSLGTGLTALVPDAVWIQIGVNDMATDRTVAEFESDLQAFVSAIATAAPNAHITLVTQTDSGYAHNPPYTDYAAGMRRVADANACHFVDLCATMGPFQVGDPYGSYLTLHPSAQTGVTFAHTIYQGLGLFPANAALSANIAALSGRPSPGTGISQLTLIDGSVQATQPLLNLRNATNTVGIYTVNTNGTQTSHTQSAGNSVSQFTVHTFGTSTGVYLCTNDVQMVLYVNGAVCQRISTTGNVAIGDVTAAAKLHVLATSEQLRLGYDATKYASFTVDNAGDMTVAPSGANLAITADVDVPSDKSFYLGAPATDGTWRITRSGNNLLMERRESGAYVTKQTISA
jgi:lysophospholipase L1-like esterase